MRGNHGNSSYTGIAQTRQQLELPESTYHIPEASTLMMEMGVNRTEELGLNDKKQLAFQEAVMEIQTTTMKLARKLGSCGENRSRDIIIIMDRGTMDCKGYIPEYVWEALLLKKNIQQKKQYLQDMMQ